MYVCACKDWNINSVYAEKADFRLANDGAYYMRTCVLCCAVHASCGVHWNDTIFNFVWCFSEFRIPEMFRRATENWHKHTHIPQMQS